MTASLGIRLAGRTVTQDPGEGDRTNSGSVHGGAREVVEGRVRGRTVVLEFPSYEAALACYRGPEYQDAAQYLKRGCEVDLVIIPGYDGAQP